MTESTRPSASLFRSITVPVLLVLSATGSMAESQDTQQTPEAEQVVVATQTGICVGAVAKDDGSVESGYGFVPSAVTGTYVQRFERSDFRGPYLTDVCLCFLKTRDDHDIDFEVVVFGDEGGHPAKDPVAVVPGTQEDVASSKQEAGEFVAIQMPNVPLPDGPIYIGARWNPSVERFLFVCNDQSEASPKSPAFFSEDRSPDWVSVFDARDPIFAPHRAIMVRARASDKPKSLEPSASTAPTLE